MKNILVISFVIQIALSSYNYSLMDHNTTSPTFESNVWEPEYLDYITMHYFATQGWAGWTAVFGQLSNFQNELKNNDGYENIAIIAVGQTNISSFNDNFCANSDLPLVMDSYPDLPIRSQFAPYYDSHALIILGYDGNYLGHIDVSGLGTTQKNYIRDILEEHYEQSILGDLNTDSTLNIQDIILLVNLILASQQNPLADLNSDNIINVLDIIPVSYTHLTLPTKRIV